MKAEKEHIHYLVALWADLDIGAEGHEDKSIFFEGPQQAAKAIRSFPRAPSIIIESGRGAHLYWLLKQVNEVTDPERVETVLKNISEHLQCDTDASVDTVLRLPETVNTKVSGKPVNCDVKFINPNFRYNLQDFENLGQRIVVPSPTSRPAVPAQAPPPDPVYTEDSREQRFEPVTLGQSLDDSLVLDETIIDELIDDISMTASMVTDNPPGDAGAVIEPGRPPSVQPPISVSPITAVRSTPSSGITSSVLERLSSSRTEVEISLVGSDMTINGVLTWNENGLIGVESGQDLYTIPLSSISFIRSRA